MEFKDNNQDLIERFVNGELSEEEKTAFDKRCQTDKAFAQQFGIYLAMREAASQPQADVIENFTNQIEQKQKAQKRQSILIIIGLIVLLTGGLYFFILQPKWKNSPSTQQEQIFANYFENPRDTLALENNELNKRVSATLKEESKNSLKTAIDYYYEGNYEKASQLLEEFSKSYSDVFMANFYLGCSYIQLGKFELAIQEFENVRDGMPLEDNFDIYDQTYWYQGLAYLRSNQQEQAISNFTYLVENETAFKAQSEEVLKQLNK